MSEATVRVRLDTRQAKSDLKNLTKEASGSASSVGKQLRSVRRGANKVLGAVGLGGAFGAGAAAVQGTISSAAGGVFSESIGGHLSRLESAVFGDLPIEGRAAAVAREETIQNFGLLAGIQGRVPEAAVTHFRMIERMQEQRERGRRMFEQDERFRGPAIEELAMSMGQAVGAQIANIMDVTLPYGASALFRQWIGVR